MAIHTIPMNNMSVTFMFLSFLSVFASSSMSPSDGMVLTSSLVTSPNCVTLVEIVIVSLFVISAFCSRYVAGTSDRVVNAIHHLNP